MPMGIEFGDGGVFLCEATELVFLDTFDAGVYRLGLDLYFDVPAGELVGVISEGKGTMPAYAQQIPMADRWAIAHYVKALQKHFN